MIKHYMPKWQSSNAGEMAKLQPVINPPRLQNSDGDGNKVVLLELVGTKSTGEEVGAKAA